jgi:hypothetical protein
MIPTSKSTLENPMDVHHKVLLPIVKRTIQQLDALFVDVAGPSGAQLASGIFQHWVNEGKVGPSALRHYAYSLSTQIDNPVERQQFVDKADEQLLHLQQGFNN